MRTIRIKLYKYEELGMRAQNKALDKWLSEKNFPKLQYFINMAIKHFKENNYEFHSDGRLA